MSKATQIAIKEVKLAIYKEVGRATDTQIKAWKEANGGEIRELSFIVEETESIHYGYVKKPSFDNMDMAMTLGEGDHLKEGKLLLENCWVGGSDFIKTDDETRWTAYLKMHSLFKLRIAEIKKL